MQLFMTLCLVRESELAEGRVYPALDRIHEVSHAIMVAVAEEVFAEKLNEPPSLGRPFLT